jgi:hypothetical protein
MDSSVYCLVVEVTGNLYVNNWTLAVTFSCAFRNGGSISLIRSHMV